MERCAIVQEPQYRDHQPGRGHPERPERYDSASSGAQAAVTPGDLLVLPPRKATLDEVALCHDRQYIAEAQEDVRSGIGTLRSGDTDVCESSFDVALLSVGGVLAAVDAVMDKRVPTAFCPVRPPGHHATHNRGMGFCMFNNIAIGARYAQRKHGVERVLIADWDVHHGNGTQDIFYSDDSVLFFSTHQWPLYPGTGTIHEKGEGKGKGTTINCPVAAGSGRKEILSAFRETLLPAARTFQPDLVMISAGFDSRRGDPIGSLNLGDKDFADLTKLVLEIADASAEGRVISVLEGGYDLNGLSSSTGAHVKALCRL